MRQHWPGSSRGKSQVPELRAALRHYRCSKVHTLVLGREVKQTDGTERELKPSKVVLFDVGLLRYYITD